MSSVGLVGRATDLWRWIVEVCEHVGTVWPLAVPVLAAGAGWLYGVPPSWWPCIGIGGGAFLLGVVSLAVQQQRRAQRVGKYRMLNHTWILHSAHDGTGRRWEPKYPLCLEPGCGGRLLEVNVNGKWTEHRITCHKCGKQDQHYPVGEKCPGVGFHEWRRLVADAVEASPGEVEDIGYRKG